MKRLISVIIAMVLFASAVSVSAAAETGTKTNNNILIVYFSATGTTELVANTIQNALGADIYEIIPTEPYTSADLNYNNSSSRSQIEQRDASARPAISGTVDNIEKYDAIFLGYPIWNGQAPKIIYTFLESYDFSGKKIIPFCTAASSNIGSSATNLQGLVAQNVEWDSGIRFTSAQASNENAITDWVNGISLPEPKLEITPEISIEGDIVTVTNAPENSTLITAFYKNNVLVSNTMRKGSGTITVDISGKSKDADILKVFLWDMETIKPLCGAKEIERGNDMGNTPAPEPEKYDTLYIHANGNTLAAVLENNESAAALVEILKKGDVVIDMSDYGGFEKVGSFGFSLPRNDTSITTEPGDIILYSGNQLTIHYGNNSWSYTRLARIENITGSELKEALGSGDVSVTLSLGR